MRKTAIVFALLASFMLTACGGTSPGGYSNGMTANDYPESDYSSGFTGEISENTPTANQNTNTNRQIIYTADATIECESLDAAKKQALADISAANGYVDSCEQDSISSYSYCTIKARIPAEKYTSFVSGINAYGEVVSQSEKAEDVTSSYIDIQAHLSSLEARRDRLFVLRDTAEDLNTLLQIEENLADVQYQLDNYNGQLKALQNQISYCTVTLDIRQPVLLISKKAPFHSRLWDSFTNGVSSFITFLQDALLFLVGNIFFILLLAAIGFAFWKIEKKNAAKRKAKIQREREHLL